METTMKAHGWLKVASIALWIAAPLLSIQALIVRTQIESATDAQAVVVFFGMSAAAAVLAVIATILFVRSRQK